MKRTPLRRKSPLKKQSLSDTALIKKEIQRVLRDIVMKRDEGCILRIRPQYAELPDCNGYAKDGHLILQADHLITRGNSATYADSRLVVCLCKGHHGWKSVGSNLRKKQYDEIVRQLLPKERVELWNRCEKESWRPSKTDWKLALAALEQEYAQMS